jgi:hypothetical protein
MDAAALIQRLDAAMARSTTWLKDNLPQHSGSYNNGDVGEFMSLLFCTPYSKFLLWPLRKGHRSLIRLHLVPPVASIECFTCGALVLLLQMDLMLDGSTFMVLPMA